jgi:serine/threonine protein kinase
MGVVYRAFDRVVERPVALKTIGFGEAPSAQLLDRLKREARAVGQLDHPNIVSLYDAGESQGLYYLVMQYVRGETLQQLIRRRPSFPLLEIFEIFRQLLGALAYSHSRGVVHRDIKPANVMLTPQGTVKLTDFGIAKLVDTTTSSSGMVMGTPSYMSPEQIQGQPVDARSDIFALGCLLYELVTGSKAFVGDTTVITYKIVHEPPPLPSVILPKIHPALEAVIMTALAKEPTQRFRSCLEFERALHNCVTERGSRVSASDQDRNQDRPRQKTNQPRRWKSALGFVLSAIAVGAILLAVPLSRPTPTRTPRVEPVVRPIGPPPVKPPEPTSVATTKPSVAAASVVRLPTRRRASLPPVAPIPAVASERRPDPEPRERDFPSERDKPPPETPESFDAMMIRGDQAYQQNHYPEALTDYLRASHLKPHDASVRRKLVLVLTLLGKTEAAQAYRK